MKNFKNFDDYLNEKLMDEEFKKAWDEFQPELEVMRAMADARLSCNITQKELARRSGINQSEISKIENGERNTSVRLLYRLAKAMDMNLKIQFVPKTGNQ